MQYYKHPVRRPKEYHAPHPFDIPTALPHDAELCHPPVSEASGSLPPLTGLSLAMAYVPYQRFEELNEPDKALACGSLFSALYMPFSGKRRPPV